MEHVWLDVNLQTPPEQVPIIGRVEYDGGDFDAFPERMGWSEDTLASNLASGRGHPVLLSIVQEWLFFGFIQEILTILEYPYKRSDFEKRVDGDPQTYATTAKLPSMLKEIAEQGLAELYEYDNNILDQVAAQLKPDGNGTNGRAWLSSLPLEKQLICWTAVGQSPKWQHRRTEIGCRFTVPVTFFRRYMQLAESKYAGYSNRTVENVCDAAVKIGCGAPALHPN